MRLALNPVLLLWVILALAAPCRAAVPQKPAQPPVDYTRTIQIQVKDVLGQPLSGVKAGVTAEWGRLETADIEPSGASGIIRFVIQPVAEELDAGLKTRDRFIRYRSAFTYRLTKDGYLTVQNRVKDSQEFAAYTDPLYQGLNRMPDTDPLSINARMATYTDYLTSPGEDSGLKAMIEGLTEAGRLNHFSLQPRSVAVTGNRQLEAGLEFGLLFDPAQNGLLNAGAALLREPVRESLVVMDRLGPGEISAYVFRVKALFQYRDKPFAEPQERIYTFYIPAVSVEPVIRWRPGQRFPLDGIQTDAGGERLDLTPALNPRDIGESRGDLLRPPAGKNVPEQ